MTTAAPKSLPDHAPPMVYTVRAVVGVCAALAVMVCGVRLYLRKFVLHIFGLDDYLVFLALVMVLVFVALSITLTTYGIGYHQATVPTADMVEVEKYVYILFCLYLWVALAVKCSLTVFIMQIFPTKWTRWVGYGIMAFMAVVTISGELPLILQCSPVEAAWDKTIPNSTCLSNTVLENLQLYQAILMLVFDVMIIGLPMPTIWKLQMPIRRRLSIIGLFAIGGLARIPLLGFQKNSTDYTYVGAVPLILMNLEFALGLITGSLPTLRVLLKFIPGLKSSPKGTHASQEWAGGASRGGYQLSEQGRWANKFRGNSGDAKSIESESQQRILVTSTVDIP
ncbi:hypothetical protein N7474_004964 [Penicillium riverlandense]|uniref:uncharacterized protein n=1 Tax=Penicillium riverlandense TaxID=1903569 RepID=UPI002547250C|nr:uncharacterized protein N7474_004964 [Penicillium riverlandense]KAJ5819373.1 hypothetical protein N7474_004964 [Penicillium riverlandense]